jgi:hypothetical protein
MWNIVLMVLGALLAMGATIAQVRHELFSYAWAGQGPSWYAMLMGAFCFLLGLVGFLHRKKQGG